MGDSKRSVGTVGAVDTTRRRSAVRPVPGRVQPQPDIPTRSRVPCGISIQVYRQNGEWDVRVYEHSDTEGSDMSGDESPF